MRILKTKNCREARRRKTNKKNLIKRKTPKEIRRLLDVMKRKMPCRALSAKVKADLS